MSARTELGCQAFGHLASPHFDGELDREERERFETHLAGCPACRDLLADFRAIDEAAQPEIAAVTAQEWDAAWSGIQDAITSDRRAAEERPLAAVARLADRLGPRGVPKALRPVLYLAAATALAALLLTVQREADESLPGARRAGGPAVEVQQIACRAPDFIPVVYSAGDDDAVTVLQCVQVGTGT